MSVEFAFGAFMLASLAVFRLFKPTQAVLIVFLGGWVVLPVGVFAPPQAGGDFPFWITGLVLPSDMLLNKAWIAPASACAGALMFDTRHVLRWRPGRVDLPMVAWCLWPLAQAALSGPTRPAAPLASALLVGCWGLPWLLGRLYFTDPAARAQLPRALALAALACLPFALVEGPFGPWLYGAVYEPHPFRFDGDVRYLGFRPIGFFEHGNQYGLWVCLGALAALWWAVNAGAAARLARTVAAGVVAMGLAAQSLGAVLLLAGGAALLGACGRLRPRTMVAAASLVLIGSGAVYLSGVVPVTHIGKDTVFGRQVVEGLRVVGRGSFAWRVAQDQKFLAAAAARPLVGTGAWDSWRVHGIRPWGVSILLVLQFGMIGLALAAAALLAPALRVGWRAPLRSGWRPQSLDLLLATLVVLAAIDALLNSFVYFPAMMLAGALAASPPRARTPDREPAPPLQGAA